MISRPRPETRALGRAARALVLACLAAAAVPAQIVIDDPVPPPVFSPAAAEFQDSLVIALAAPAPGATILYTLDGTVPGEYSIRYAAPFVITSTTVIRAVAIRNAQRSAVVTAVYVLAEQVAAPVASPPGRFLDSSGSPLAVTLSTATPGATILYTLDGSDPTFASPRFFPGQPLLIAAPATLKAVAVKDGRRSVVVAVRFERGSTGIRGRTARAAGARARPVRTWEREGRRLDGARR